MKKSEKIISSPLLICFAAVFGICTIQPLAARTVAEKHAAASEKEYARQDKAAEKSRRLAAEGKYDEAIAILKEDVVSMLELEAADVDAWKARKRLAEYTKELRDMQLTHGGKQIEAAEKAIVNAQYDQAIAFASLAAKITPLLEKKAKRLIDLANSRRMAADRALKVSTKTTDPTLEVREKELRLALAAARLLFRKGQYDEAMKKIEEVYAVNPYNDEAAYLASQIYKRFYEIGYQRRKADVQAQFAYEAWQWVEPTFPIPQEEEDEETAIAKEDSDAEMQKKLDEILIPDFEVEEATVEAAIEKINGIPVVSDKGVTVSLIQKNEEKKPAKDGEKPEGAPMEGEEGAEEGEEGAEEGEEGEGEEEAEGGKEGGKSAANETLVTLKLKNVTLRQLLGYISFLTDYSWHTTPSGIEFGAPDSQMKTQDYTILDSVKFLIVGRKPAPAAPAASAAPAEEGGEGGDGAEAPEGGEGGEGGGEEVMEGDPGFDDGAGAAMDTVADDELSPEALQKFFSLYGIEFPKGSSISYFNNRITMNNTAANHRLMVDLLARINVNDPLIEVEVKSIELSENDMEELGFNWALSGIGESGTSKQWMFAKGENTNPGGSLSMLNGLLSGIDSRLISNLNIFPDVFGSWKPFGSDVNFNLSLTINALDRSDRTEQISAPRVLVRNGVTAVVKMTKAYFFPEEWEELEVETEEVGDNGDLRLDITYPSPTFSESESNIGTQFTVTPTILDRNVIRLQLNPKVTAYTGKDEYEVVLIVEERNGDTWNKEEMRFIVWRPIIATREVSVTVDVNHGETLVIGGLSDSQSQKRLDKIPILADLPLIGRLFQNQSEISIRRNMLIFVTARLVDNSGISLPVESKVGNGGIPALKR